MVEAMNFNRQFEELGSYICKTGNPGDMGYTISELLFMDGEPCYPIEALLGASFAYVSLDNRRPPESLDHNIDIIIKMSDNLETSVFEIILFDRKTPFYGGYAFGEKLEVLDEIVNGFRTLLAHDEEQSVYYQFDAEERMYVPRLHS